MLDLPLDEAVDAIRFVFKASKADPDTLNYWQAREADDWEEFRAAMKKEIQDLQQRGTWKVVRRSEAGSKQIVPSTWTFK